jgi:hypothetical protein
VIFPLSFDGEVARTANPAVRAKDLTTRCRLGQEFRQSEQSLRVPSTNDVSYGTYRSADEDRVNNLLGDELHETRNSF